MKVTGNLDLNKDCVVQRDGARWGGGEAYMCVQAHLWCSKEACTVYVCICRLQIGNQQYLFFKYQQSVVSVLQIVSICT